MYGTLLLLHILGATVWTGGHLVLAVAILPKVLKQRAPAELLQFEAAYERIGLPALLIQVRTGFWLAHRLAPEPFEWLDWSQPVSRLVGIKLLLLMTTVIFAVDARLRMIPKLTAERLNALTWHIVPVTVVSVLFVLIGVAFRTGWFY